MTSCPLSPRCFRSAETSPFSPLHSASFDSRSAIILVRTSGAAGLKHDCN
jgi:hypothetical protein